MKPLRTLLLLLAFGATVSLPAQAAEESEAKTKTKKKKTEDVHRTHGPGLLNRLWEKVHPTDKATPTGAAGTVVPGPTTTSVDRELGSRKVRLSMSLEPEPLKLSEVRQLKVNLRVANQTKRLVQLEFPTTQRIEVIIRNAVGALVEQWSEDRSFQSDPGMVSINPGEHLEYSATVSTRDLTAGETYTVEALFPNYEPLRLQRKITPEK